jgi:hypothetical protein
MLSNTKKFIFFSLPSGLGQTVPCPAHPPVGGEKNLVAAADWPKTLEHGRIRVETLIGPVMAFLELFNRHSSGFKDHMVHVIEVPVAGYDPIFAGILFV